MRYPARPFVDGGGTNCGGTNSGYPRLKTEGFGTSCGGLLLGGCHFSLFFKQLVSGVAIALSVVLRPALVNSPGKRNQCHYHNHKDQKFALIHVISPFLYLFDVMFLLVFSLTITLS
jgi:hypothetical protein